MKQLWDMTDEELNKSGPAVNARCDQCKEDYLTVKEMLGKDHPVTNRLWVRYGHLIQRLLSIHNEVQMRLAWQVTEGKQPAGEGDSPSPPIAQENKR